MNQTLEQIAKTALESVELVARERRAVGKAIDSIKNAQREAGNIHISRTLHPSFPLTDQEQKDYKTEYQTFLERMDSVRRAYQSDVFSRVQTYANQGDVGLVCMYLGFAEEFDKLEDNPERRNEKVMDILNLAYRKGVEFELNLAETNAQTGSFYECEKRIKEAKEYALKTQTPFSDERAKQIMTTACKNGIELYLNCAGEDAKRGGEFKYSGVHYAEDAAKRINVDISQRVGEVKKLFKK